MRVVFFSVFRILTVVLYIAGIGISASAQEEDSLLLYLPFENTPNGMQGEIPVVSFGLIYHSGIKGQAAYISESAHLLFQKEENFDEKKGTLEFWLHTHNAWIGSSGYHILSCGGIGGMLFEKDGATALRMIANQYGNGIDPEVGVAMTTGAMHPEEWNHIAYTWGNSLLKMYINGLVVDQWSYNFSLPDIVSGLITIGYSTASLDEFKIYNRIKPEAEILSSYYESYTTSIEGQTGIAGKISVSPNPASDKLLLSFEELFLSEEFTLDFFDAQGKSLRKVELPASEKEFHIPVLDLPNGIYTLQIACPQKTYYKKIVILHP